MRFMKKKIIILVPIIIVLSFVFYKCCLLLYYKDLNGYSIDYDKVTVEEKNVKVDKTLANTKIDNMNIYIPEELVDAKIREEYHSYVPKNENVEYQYHTSYMHITKGTSFYNYSSDDNKRLQTIGYKDLMKKNNLKSEADLVKYYFFDRKKNNIFTSRNDIKMNYLSEMSVKNSPIDEDYKNSNYYLSGDLDGILSIKKDGRNYFFEIYNELEDEYYSVYISRYTNKRAYIEIVNDEVFDKILQSIYFD